MEGPLVSVVVPCRDDAYLDTTLASLTRQQGSPSFEVVIVAAGALDIRDRLETWSHRLDLRVIEAPKKTTAGANRNVGVASARGQRLLFIDADDTVGEHYIGAMAEALDTYELVCSRIDVTALNPPPYDLRTQAQASGLVTGDLGFLPYAGAGTLGIRRALFEAIGGFDPRFPCYEEADLCWRIQLLGRKPPQWVPQAVLHYRLEQSRTKRWRKAVVFGRAQAALYRRYRHAGMPRETLRQAFSEWRRLLWQLARRLASRSALGGLGWEGGVRYGRLRSSLRHRVPYF